MTPADERLLLFRRISAATGQPAGGEGDDAPAPPAPVPGEGDRLERFGRAFEAAGGVLFQGPPESALHDLAEELRAAGVTELFHPPADVEARRVAEALVPFGPFALTTGEAVRAGGAPVTAGFRTADAGIAETGTVVETSAGGNTFLPGLLADVHVAIVPASRVAESIDEALIPYVADPPRNISFLTGPSKTADIEQTLTVGAHGPKKAIVLLVE
ncbi:MAG: LUD domain-containing protein [Deltaproteobacteria bacterium]|nr:LUD domain-containing protein [Deltaproteobacteria bacterium]